MGFVSEEIGVVRFKGNFDLQGMLRMVYSHLKNKNYDFYEKTHKAKIPELELAWVAEKKVTPYYKYTMEIEMHFYDLREIDAQDENGNPIKLTNGRFTITFDGDVDRGFATDWEDNKSHFRKFLKGFFENLTKREFMVKHAQTLILETAAVRDKINSFLGMTASQ